jgi:hypothetical protein
MLKVIKIDTVYPAPEDDEEDYCPEGDSSSETIEVSFRELVDLMRTYNNPSCSRALGEIYEWTQAETEQDYRTGEFTERSIHYSRNNPTKNAKYWRAAMTAAGLINH